MRTVRSGEHQPRVLWPSYWYCAAVRMRSDRCCLSFPLSQGFSNRVFQDPTIYHRHERKRRRSSCSSSSSEHKPEQVSHRTREQEREQQQQQQQQQLRPRAGQWTALSYRASSRFCVCGSWRWSIFRGDGPRKT